ncbi:MAG: hypothetical protein AAB870_04605 [Patescibacteria group bacterium]
MKILIVSLLAINALALVTLNILDAQLLARYNESNAMVRDYAMRSALGF